MERKSLSLVIIFSEGKLSPWPPTRQGAAAGMVWRGGEQWSSTAMALDMQSNQKKKKKGWCIQCVVLSWWHKSHRVRSITAMITAVPTSVVKKDSLTKKRV